MPSTEQANPQNGAPESDPTTDGASSNGGNAEDVTDVEYEEVDDKN